MSGSKSKTTQSATQTQNQTATSTPTAPAWYTDLVGGFGNQVGAFMGSGQSPYTGASPLQQQAFQGASNLGGPSLNFGGARNPNDPAGPQVMPQMGGGDGAPQTMPPAGGQGGQFGTFDLAGMLGLGAGMAGANTTPGAAGYNASGPVTPQGYSAATAGSRDFNAADLQARMSPYLDQVQGAFTADADATAGRVRAGQSAAAAVNGGVRNSNNAVQAGITEGEIARARGAGIAGIQDNAFRTAADILGQDNNRAAQVSMANAGFQNDALGRQYQGNLTAGLDFAGRQDAAGQFGANAINQNNQFNAGQQDNALARMLQSAGLLTNLGQAQGADTRANIGLQADLGGQQRDIANQGSEATRLAFLQQLLTGIPTDALIGRTGTTTGTSNSSGKSSTTGFGFDLADFWKPAIPGAR